MFVGMPNLWDWRVFAPVQVYLRPVMSAIALLL